MAHAQCGLSPKREWWTILVRDDLTFLDLNVKPQDKSCLLACTIIDNDNVYQNLYNTRDIEPNTDANLRHFPFRGNMTSVLWHGLSFELRSLIEPLHRVYLEGTWFKVSTLLLVSHFTFCMTLFSFASFTKNLTTITLVPELRFFMCQ